MDDSRFFTMTQFWQSLVVAVFIGGVVIFGTTYVLTKQNHHQAVALPIIATTTTPTPEEPISASVAAAPVITDPFAAAHLSGRAAIVVDLSTGQTLYSQAADMQLPLASLTKLLTIFEADKILTPDAVVTISSTSLAQEGDYGFTEGETFAYKDISRLAMVASSNDAAEAIAEAAANASGVSQEEFMNHAVNDAGLTHTYANNGTGLDIDATEAGAYGSARDIAKLAGEFANTVPSVARATTRSAVTITSLEGMTHSLQNTNPDVSSISGLQLSKTGYTDLAGGNLAIVFDAAIDHPVAVVVLGSTRDARFLDVEKLIRATRTYFTQQSSQ